LFATRSHSEAARGSSLRRQLFSGSVLTLSILALGCGAQYRPVVSAINPVGPAAQPTKYAIAISNPSVQDTVTGYNISGNVLTLYLSGTNPFAVGQSLTLSGFQTSTFLNGQTVTVLSSGYSDSQFQASFTSPDTSATENGLVSLSRPGLLTFVDFAGDTVLTTPQILSNPSYLALGAAGGQGYIINSAGSFNEFSTGNPSTLIASQISQSTLSTGASPLSISGITLSGTTSASVFVPQPGLAQVAALSGTGSLIQNLAVSNNPVYVVGASGALRGYVISQGDGVTPSYVSSVESGNLAISGTLNVGINPVYGVMTADDKRAFILNKGSGTVSVVNVVNNALDSNSTLGPGQTIAVGQNPVWADLAPITSQLVVLNQGDGVHPGSLSIIDIPLCNAAAQPTNPNCDASNPVDATGFGTVVATVPVGVNPTMVSALQDGSYAYVVNSGNATTPGSLTVVNMVSGAVVATIPAGPDPGPSSSTPATSVYGHPNIVAATTGTPTGKVYITSPDSDYLTILETDTNTIETHVDLQGLGVRVVVTAP
jgi:hypothetical protein